MKLSKSVKPISYLKAHASEILRKVVNDHKTFVITQNGEAKAIVQDVALYEQTQDTLALLKMLAQSTQSKKKGHYKTVKKSFTDLRAQIK